MPRTITIHLLFYFENGAQTRKPYRLGWICKKKKYISVMVILLYSFYLLTVGDDRPLRFQSFPSNPPQSFQQINFFGPSLSPQQSAADAGSASTPSRQALFFSSLQNSGGQPLDSRNPIFESRAVSPLSTLASSSIGSIQRGQPIRNPTLESGFNPQRQLPTEVAANAFPTGAARLTPASTSIQQPGPQQRQKPIVQFQFNRDQVQPMNPAGNFNRLQQPELKLELLPEIHDFPLPVPLGFRTPFFHQQTPPTEVKPQTEEPRPSPPEPVQESAPPPEPLEESLPFPVQEIPDVQPPAQIETDEFQRVRPTIQQESPLNFEPPATPRPSQLQVLSDQPEEAGRDSQNNRRNRLRRPLSNGDTPATELPNSPRRVPPVRESNPNLRPVLLVDDTPALTTGSFRQRFRSTTIAAPLTTTEAEEQQQPVTIRTRAPFLRPIRPSTTTTSRTRPAGRLFTTTPQTIEEEITTRAPATTNRFFGGRRPIRPLPVEEEPEILITTTTQRAAPTTGRVRSNFRFNSPEQTVTTTVKSVRFNTPEQSRPEVETVQSPVVPVPVDVDALAANSVTDNQGSVDQQPELISKPEEEPVVEVTTEPDVEYYYDDVVDEGESTQSTNETTLSTTTVENIPEPSTSTAPPPELPAEAELLPPPSTEAIATAVEQPVVENDHKPIIDEPIIHEPVTEQVVIIQPPTDAAVAAEEADGPTTVDAEQVEEAPANKTLPTANNNNNNNNGGAGPSKLKIFNLGRRNTSSVNLDNIVFVPNLDGFVLPASSNNPVTPNTVSVETSRSVTVVKMSVDPLPTTTESPAGSLLPGDRQSKAIASSSSKTDNLASSQTTAVDGKQPPVKEEQAGDSLLPEPTKAPENRNDELDLIQSDLFDKHLNNNFNMEANKATNATTTTPAAPTSSRPPFRPGFKRPFDFLGTTTTAVPATEQIEVVPTSSTTETVAAVSTSTAEPSTTTTTAAEAAETTTLSLFDRLFGKKVVAMDDISSLLPPGFEPPKEVEEAPVTTQVVAPVTEPAAPVTQVSVAPVEVEAPKVVPEAPVGPPPPPVLNPLDKILGSIKDDDISAFLPPGFKMEQPPPTEESATTTTTTTTTTAKNPFAGLFDTANMDDLGGLLPSNFKHHLFTPAPSKTTPTAVTSESSSAVAETSTASPSEPSTTTAKKGLVFPTRASPARTTTSEKPKIKPTQSAVEIKSGWPVR